MILNKKLMPNWPKLAWVAEINSIKNNLNIRHGSFVEYSEKWIVEAVWCGKFNEGAFDKAELVFGSGVRMRADTAVFVSSSTGNDRLLWVDYDDRIFVSNTLPGLLQAANLSLKTDYLNYTTDMISVETHGIKSYINKIPSTGPDINIVYYNNLKWIDGELIEVEKPDETPSFTFYKSYEDFLKTVAKQLEKNATDEGRACPVEMFVSISSGYDSVATSVVAKHAGCNKAGTIINSNSFWRGSDSGEKIAQRLGMSCKCYKHKPQEYKNEIAIWAGAGIGGGRNLTLFDYPKPLCLYFCGVYGDTIWDIHQQGLTEPKGDIDTFLCEFRLIEGVFVTLIPWWGVRKASAIQRISQRDEMKPWTLNSDYDRPIARRLAEEAGVPRNEFGVRKKNSSSNTPVRWPSTPAAQKSLKKFLRSTGIRPLGDLHIRFLQILSFFLNVLYKNTVKKIGVKKWWRPWLNVPGRHLLFVWSNHHLKKNYQEIEH